MTGPLIHILLSCVLILSLNCSEPEKSVVLLKVTFAFLLVAFAVISGKESEVVKQRLRLKMR